MTLFVQAVQIWLPVVFFTLIFVVLLWYDKLPSVKSVQEIVSMVNSRGGNIVVLSAGSLYFFVISVKVFYFLFHLQVNGKLTGDNALAMTAITWLTGSVFGGAFGALLKTMTGESTKARVTDFPPEGATTSTATTTSTLTFSGGGN